ncbi:hypothetical protein P7K49_030010 [Saguinus oedipus]|uniref:Uncharacterized protein n=1 Tax=Saguinus oedipus TaxID=9490 RepID=A0ABQ9U8Y9_SAGOE|nr:hypothetical protein P7K49_030010 [Saguinus oedipus]
MHIHDLHLGSLSCIGYKAKPVAAVASLFTSQRHKAKPVATVASLFTSQRLPLSSGLSDEGSRGNAKTRPTSDWSRRHHTGATALPVCFTPSMLEAAGVRALLQSGGWEWDTECVCLSPDLPQVTFSACLSLLPPQPSWFCHGRAEVSLGLGTCMAQPAHPCHLPGM